MEDLNNVLLSKKTSVPKNKGEMCWKHEYTELMYYCNNCKVATCSDCAMFGDEHKNHKFQKLGEVYEKHVDMIK